MDTTEVLVKLTTNQATGLTTTEAQARLEKYGPNELEDEEKESIWDKIKESLEDLLARILLLAAFISFVIALLGDGEEGIAAYVEPFVILLILVLNAIVAVYQDLDAESALDALKDMSATTCTVLRDGKWNKMPAQDLVPGDIVEVKMGDSVPADLRIIKLLSISLLVEEAPLTGESVSVHKQIEKIDSSSTVLQEQRNMLFSSTIVNYGQALGVVVFTGSKTAIGRVQQQVKEAAEEEEDTPLKKKLDDFGEKLANLIGIVCLLVWIMNYRNFFDDIHGSAIKGCIYYFKIAIALAVAAIPEGLPAVITTCLALGTRKMAKNNAIVRRLPSVETLGCTTVICSDKTGTLTKNQMSAVKIAFVASSNMTLKEYRVEEQKNAYDPRGNVLDNFATDRKNFESLVKSFTTGMSINNRASIKKQDGDYVRVGEPTEAAMIVLAEKLNAHENGNYCSKRAEEVEVIATLDFTSERKCMSTLVSKYSNSKDLLIKGAPDRVIKNCNRYLSQENPGTPSDLSSAQKQQLLDQVAKLSAEGLRCLALAEVPKAGKLSEINDSNKSAILGNVQKYSEYETDAVFLGIVCIKDPVREEVKPAIQQCKIAGIRVIMITGDSKETATAIAQELDIIEKGQDIKSSVFTGD